MKGKIIKGIAGFYYVHVADDGHTMGTVYECKAKGVFRKDHRKPLVGDDVEMDVLDEAQKKGNIRELLPRHSELIRPAVANVDQALVIFAITKPQPNFNLLDRFLVMMQQQDIPCIICFNKQDIDEEGKKEDYRAIYEQAGFRTITVSAARQEGIDTIQELLRGKTTTVAGPSGVGKSSLVNCLQSGTVMETGSISEKIERGKHTTRHSELISIAQDTYILDTPGFSSLGIVSVGEGCSWRNFIRSLPPFEKYCKFGGCSHISEPVCGIKAAVAEGEIPQIRYENYCLLYDELKKSEKILIMSEVQNNLGEKIQRDHCGSNEDRRFSCVEHAGDGYGQRCLAGGGFPGKSVQGSHGKKGVEFPAQLAG